MKLKLIEKHQELPDVTSFIWAPPEQVSWIPGQYMLYALDLAEMDDRKNKRYFSISTAPHEKSLRITARYPKDRPSSFKKALFSLPIGAEIEAEGPGGRFLLEDPNIQNVFIAGGIGITAFRPMLADLDFRSQPISVTLLYANRTPDSVVFKKELEDIAGRNPNFKIHYIYDPERIDETVIKKYVGDLSKPTFYASGPEPMVEAMLKMLEDMGIGRERIKRDYYPGYNWP